MQNVRVRILGDLQLEGCPTAQLGRRQVRTLFKVLAVGHGHPVTVDRLVDCLWGDLPPARPAEQISVLASRLRGVVGADRVLRNDAGYTLIVDWLDLDALREYLVEADRRLLSGATVAAGSAASAGLSLIRGPLLADEPDAWWADSERAAADMVVSRLRHIVASAALAGGDWAEAAHLAGELLLSDPYDESALRVSMEALARSGRQASALATYAAVRERVGEELGVGLSEETEALHSAVLLDKLPKHRKTDTLSASAAVELPGRELALHTLDSLVDHAAGGQGQIAVVEGEAGIGKSRLLQVWADRLGGRGVGVVTVSCDELGRSLPLQPLLDAAEELVRRAGSEGAMDILGPDAAVLGPLLGAQTEPAGVVQLTALTDPGAGQSLLFAALFGVLRRQSEHRPLVLIVDDIHLADTATTAWLGRVSRRLADSRVTIVAAQRAEEGVSLPGATVITLGPLSLEDAELIVGTDRAPALHARSGGHPLLLVELAAAGADEEMPATIRQAVEERCSRAGAAAVTLRTAAVIGPEIDLDVLTAVTSTGTSELLDHLEQGLERRFLVEEGQTFVFAHALIREALASTVGASRSAFIHREAARALGRRPGADPLAVAHHARLGGEWLGLNHVGRCGTTAVLRFDEERRCASWTTPSHWTTRPTPGWSGPAWQPCRHATNRPPRTSEQPASVVPGPKHWRWPHGPPTSSGTSTRRWPTLTAGRKRPSIPTSVPAVWRSGGGSRWPLVIWRAPRFDSLVRSQMLRSQQGDGRGLAGLASHEPGAPSRDAPSGTSADRQRARRLPVSQRLRRDGGHDGAGHARARRGSVGRPGHPRVRHGPDECASVDTPPTQLARLDLTQPR